MTREHIADVFPDVVAHAERPILRTAPAPLFLLSRLVRDAGIKVVLTGEGADEMFAGYDLFREAKVRRFWGRQPGSTLTAAPSRAALSVPGAIARRRERHGTAVLRHGNLGTGDAPGFAHEPRWRSAAALQRLFSAELRNRVAASTWWRELVATLPPEFRRWSSLAQDQYLEIRTLLSGYLLSSQGDRMLMAHSVEGRFPFLDGSVVALANSLPPAYKLRVLDEKHVLKRVGDGLLPHGIVRRTKQPYRAPDALAFAGAAAPEWARDAIERTCRGRRGRLRPARRRAALAQVPHARRRRSVLQRRQHGRSSGCCRRSSSTSTSSGGVPRRRRR